jgi:hypothetical protein
LGWKSPPATDEGAGSECVSTNRIRMSGVSVVECQEDIEDFENELDRDAHEGRESQAVAAGG